MTDKDYMAMALEEASRGAESGEVPVGCIAVYEGEIVARAHNSPISSCDPTAHAEINVLRQAAGVLGAYRIPGVELYVTLEPCLMCFGAMLHARVSRLCFGANDPKIGFSRIYNHLREDAFFNHSIKITSGILEDECASLLRSFFRSRRNK